MSEIRLCNYFYDPLDQLIQTSIAADAESQRFYCRNRLTTEIRGQLKQSVFRHDDQLLAQQHSEGTVLITTLLTTDQQRSVLHTVDTDLTQSSAYSPYGFLSTTSAFLSMMGFNGERLDPVTQRYILGNGYRPFNPVLMRFDIPDSWSPFGNGGLNAYAYCSGDPINQLDESGHSPIPTRIATQLRSALARARERLSLIHQPNKYLQQDYHSNFYKLGNRHFRPMNKVKNSGNTTTFTYSSGLERTVQNKTLTLAEASYNSTPGRYLQPDSIEIPHGLKQTLNELESTLAPTNYDNHLAHSFKHSNYGKNFYNSATDLLAGNVKGVPPHHAEQSMKQYINSYEDSNQPRSGLRQSFVRALSNHQTSIRRT